MKFVMPAAAAALIAIAPAAGAAQPWTGEYRGDCGKVECSISLQENKNETVSVSVFISSEENEFSGIKCSLNSDNFKAVKSDRLEGGFFDGVHTVAIERTKAGITFEGIDVKAYKNCSIDVSGLYKQTK